MSKKYQNKVLSIIRSTNRMKNVPCAQPHHELIKDLYYGPSANRLLTVNLQKEFDIEIVDKVSKYWVRVQDVINAVTNLKTGKDPIWGLEDLINE